MRSCTQCQLFDQPELRSIEPFFCQLLKWVGNKQRFAHKIARYFPRNFGTYFEPFLGSGGVLGTLAPDKAIASDSFGPLIDIWRALKAEPDTLKRWYCERWNSMRAGDKVLAYEKIKASYNSKPNGADLLFICRACYGGVVRFRKTDGYISTPCGVQDPISPASFAERVDEWHWRTRGTTFSHMDFEEAMSLAKRGDLVYCDPPYSHTQSILYGAQSFSLERLFEITAICKERGVNVAISIDGTKRSGDFICALPIPEGLFEREVFIDCGRSRLKCFQMDGRTMEGEGVTDRLVLTY